MDKPMIPPQNVSETAYQREVRKRRSRAQETIERWEEACPWQCALVVLSCKRPEPLARCLASLRENMVDWPLLSESWHVCNGEDAGIRRVIENQAQAGLRFYHYIWHKQNLGMGRAINDVLFRIRSKYILFVEDDLELVDNTPFLSDCFEVFRERPEIGHIRLKTKDAWDKKSHRRIGPEQSTSSGIRFHPWLPSKRWSFSAGQRPWYPVGIHGGWSLGPVMFRRSLWLDSGTLPGGQGRGQAIAAEEGYAKIVNRFWLSCRLVDKRPFHQPETPESPGFLDQV